MGGWTDGLMDAQTPPLFFTLLGRCHSSNSNIKKFRTDKQKSHCLDVIFHGIKKKKVLKSSLKRAQAEVSSLSGSVFMLTRMRLAKFFSMADVPYCFSTNMFSLLFQFALFVFSY